jgi:hypothetical protein
VQLHFLLLGSSGAGGSRGPPRGHTAGVDFAVLPGVSRFFLIAALLIPAAADAQPPANADPALGPWFRSLLVPGTSISCCSVTDCRPTEYRIEADHYEALIGENWIIVPPDKILQRTDNPTGHAVVCWTPQRGILCFVRATES